MRKLTVYELFNGYKDIDLPPDLDINKKVSPTVLSSTVDQNSLLFITDKVASSDETIDCSTICSDAFAIVTSYTKRLTNISLPVIRVKNVRAALAYALSNLYGIDFEKTKFIGVTGTNGKTTTATLIYKILRLCGYKVGFIGTGKIICNNKVKTDDFYSMTTPDPTLLYPSIAEMEAEGCAYIVMEVSSHSIALGKIAPIKFEYSIFTNLDDDHLDFHTDKEDYYRTKLSLFKSSKKGLFNFDDSYCLRAYKSSKCEKTSFGIVRQGDTYATEIEVNGLQGSSFFYRSDGLIFKVRSPLPGAINVYNTLAALRCVIDLGIKPCIANRAIERIGRIDGRMEIVNESPLTVIDYAHTPSAFDNCLKTLKRGVKCEQKLFLIFGCGGDRDKNKRPIFGEIAEKYADEIIVTEDNSRNESFLDIAADIARGIRSKSFTVIEDRLTAITYAYHLATENDVIAIIGKGHEKYKIIGNSYIPFDEKKIIQSIIAGNVYESEA